MQILVQTNLIGIEKMSLFFLSEDFNNLELEIRGNWVDFQM